MLKRNKLFNTRLEILNSSKQYVILNGWNEKLIDSLCNKKKYTNAQIISLFPEGYINILEFYLSCVNDNLITECKKIDLIRLKTHERIKKIIMLKIKNHEGEKKLVKKTLITLMSPRFSKLSLSSLYRTVDQIWYIAGDNSTDFNFYTKRIILASVYTSTIIYWCFRNKDITETEIFLEKQLKKVSRIPKIKNKFKNSKSFISNFFSITKKFSEFRR